MGSRSSFLAEKARRDKARKAFRTRVADLRADYEQRGIAGRVLDEIAAPAAELFDDAVDVAVRHPGIVGGTLGAIAIWIIRNPLLAMLRHEPDVAASNQENEEVFDEKA